MKNSRPQECPVLKFLDPPLALPLFFTLQYTWREHLKQGSCDSFIFCLDCLNIVKFSIDFENYILNLLCQHLFCQWRTAKCKHDWIYLLRNMAFSRKFFPYLIFPAWSHKRIGIYKTEIALNTSDLKHHVTN